ncbi:MAG TPA: hypothetical protein VGA36_00835 [Nitriliruptorales bacterium]
MQPMLRETHASLRDWPVFAFYALLTLGYAAFIGVMFAQMALELDVFLPGQFGQMQHGAVGSHRVHDVTFGLLVTTMVVGVLAQLRRPAKNVTGMVMALIPFVGLLLAAVLSADAVDVVLRRNPLYQVAALAGMTTLVHPAGRRLFRSFRVLRVNWMMVALVGIAAVPLVAFASTNIDLQGTVPDDHVNLGHYGFMAAFSFTVIAAGLLASLRADGWRLTAWVVGLLPALLGLTSLIYPDTASSLSPIWALAAIAWGVMFVAVAERTKHTKRPTLLGPRGVLSPKETTASPSAVGVSGTGQTHEPTS